MELNEFWLDSTQCATNCRRESKREIFSKECCIIRYNLFEPYYEELKNDFVQIGKYRGDYNNFYRYTSMLFFGTELEKLIKDSSEIQITFELDYDSPVHLGANNDNNKDKFNNSLLLIGHSFRSQRDLLDKWNDQNGYDELKYNFNCPYVISLYENLRSALINKNKTFTITIDENILKEFEKHNVKGFHLYCHDVANMSVRIKSKCEVLITKYKNFYDNIISSKNALIVSNKHVYNDECLRVGSPHNTAYFLFDELESFLDKAEEIELTFALSWFKPSMQASLIGTNTNFLNTDPRENPVVLSNHGFINEEELYNCKTKNELQETDKEHYDIEVHASFKNALEEGKAIYSFILNKDDIDMFKKCNTKGFKLGLKNTQGAGSWMMSKNCTVKINKYKEDYSPTFIPGNNSNWFNIDKPALIGTNLSENSGEHCAFYFFKNKLYEKLNAARIQNITVRFYFNKLEYTDNNINVRYMMCGHNYSDINDVVKEDYIVKANGICEFYTNKEADYIDIILNKNQIDFLKNYDGLCFYSKQNTALTGHGNKVSVFIDYLELDIYTSIREFDPIELKTFITEDSMAYDKKFIVGTNKVGYLYRPFMYMGDNFYDFINKVDVVDIKLLVAADHVNYYDDKPSADLLKLEFYTHDITSNNQNYAAYKYKDLLFSTELGNSRYTEIDLNKSQINLLKNARGLGAIVINNTNNDFLVINTFKIIVTYVNIA